MRINLLLDNPGSVINDYINIDSFADGKDSRIVGDVISLSNDDGEICCFGEADEIIAKDILEYFGPSQIDNVINTWCKKLKIGGKLILSSVDIESIARGIVYGNINNVQHLNELIYGKQEQTWQIKKCAFSLHIIVPMLEGRGMKVLKKLEHDFRFIVVAERIK